jgi:hypothetical protein
LFVRAARQSKHRAAEGQQPAIANTLPPTHFRSLRHPYAIPTSRGSRRIQADRVDGAGAEHRHVEANRTDLWSDRCVRGGVQRRQHATLRAEAEGAIALFEAFLK